MPSTKELAQQLAEAHESGDVVVLPTVWDAWSASVAVDAGFTGVSVGSHPVADALGSADGEHMKFADYLAAVQRIVDAVPVPVSVDAESGYGLDPAELVHRLLEVGAVGVNLEDVVHSEGRRVRGRQEHADYIAAARQAADEADTAFVINGRTDAVKLGTDHFPDPVQEAVERIRLLEQAGARAVYPVGLTTGEDLSRMVEAVAVPVNATAHPVEGHGSGHLSALRDLGVRRVTFGPLWQKWLSEQSAAQLAKWLT